MTRRYKFLLTSTIVLNIGLAQLDHTERAVSFTNGSITLSGTLTLPQGKPPFTAVILITGSGGQDRDNSTAEIPDYKPFQWLTHELAVHGIATLRYDDRGTGESTGTMTGATTADLATDAESALNYLLSVEEIDHTRIGLLGHSEGAVIAARVAARNPSVAFVITLAGPSVNGYTLVKTQMADLLQNEVNDVQTQHLVESEIKSMAFVLLHDWQSLEAHLVRTYTQQLETLPADQRPTSEEILEIAERLAEENLTTVYKDPWYQYFLWHDPASDWKKVDVPVLAVFGEADKVVNPSLNQETLRAALGDPSQLTVVVLPNANHFFLTPPNDSANDFANATNGFAPGLLETISSWLLAQREEVL